MLFNNRTYDVLKFVAQILLPGLGALYFGLAQIWGLPKAEEIVGSVTVLDTFLGLLLGLSTKSYNNDETRYDGTMVIDETEEGSRLRMQNVDMRALAHKNEITFRIDHNS